MELCNTRKLVDGRVGHILCFTVVLCRANPLLVDVKELPGEGNTAVEKGQVN